MYGRAVRNLAPVEPFPRRVQSKVRCYVLPDAAISTPIERARKAVHWKQQFDELDAVVKQHGANMLGIEDFRAYKTVQDFAHRVSDILNVVSTTLQPQDIDALAGYAFEA